MTRCFRLLASSLLPLLATSSLLADLSPDFVGFGVGPARHLMTKAEQKQWKAITSDSDAQAFIDLFWARRDPTPDTPENEYRGNFEVRVRDADNRFTTKKARGALSERGRILILLGPPTKILDKAEGSGLEGASGDPSAGRKSGRTQNWIYSGKELPPGTKFTQVEINFFDADSKGEYVLSVGGSSSTASVGGFGAVDTTGGSFARALAFEAIGSAAERAIVSPDLKEPRKFATSPTVVEREVPVEASATPEMPDVAAVTVSSTASLKSESFRAAIEKARASAVDTAGQTVVWREFEPGDDGIRTGIHLSVPSASGLKAGAKVRMFGSIVDAAGKAVVEFEENAGIRGTAGDLFVDRAAMLPAGRYDAVIGVANNGAPVAVGRATMDVRGDDGKPSVGELVLTNNLQPLSMSQLDDAFAMGGMKVVPRANGRFRKDERLWYVFQVRNPSREAGTPRIKVSVIVHGIEESNSSVAARTAEKEVMTNELAEGGKFYWVGNSIPLSTFSEGKYEVMINVSDAISNRKFQLKESFSIE